MLILNITEDLYTVESENPRCSHFLLFGGGTWGSQSAARGGTSHPSHPLAPPLDAQHTIHCYNKRIIYQTIISLCFMLYKGPRIPRDPQVVGGSQKITLVDFGFSFFILALFMKQWSSKTNINQTKNNYYSHGIQRLKWHWIICKLAQGLWGGPWKFFTFV